MVQIASKQGKIVFAMVCYKKNTVVSYKRKIVFLAEDRL